MRKKASFVLGTFFFVLFSIGHAAPAPRALPPETEAKIKQLLSAPELQAAHIGVLISALGSAATPQVFPAAPYDEKTQPILFAQDADKRFLPASNVKLFTSAMALKVLGPEKTFATRVSYREATKGAGAGKLELIGGGDPAFGAAALGLLTNRVRESGIKVFTALGTNNSLFKAESFAGRYPDGWTLDDSLWYYGPSVSALVYERNQIDVNITGGNQTGEPVKVEYVPTLPSSKIVVDVKTGAVELAQFPEDSAIVVDADAPSGALSITGAIAPRVKTSLGVAVPDITGWIEQAFVEALEKSGVKQVTQSRLKGKPQPVEFGTPREIARHESPPVRELLKRLLKNSDNLYAEMMLRNAAIESLKGEISNNYAARGHQLIFDWLKENGVATDGLKFTDGSGLSRYNMVTPRAVAGVLAAAEKLPGATAFYDALPIAGVDGTMKNRCKGTAAENNARAKSGTFSIVSCLSGYVTTRDGNRLSVVLLTNFAPDGKAARRFQDDVFAALAETKLQ